MTEVAGFIEHRDCERCNRTTGKRMGDCPCGSPRCPGLKAEVVRNSRWSWTLHITDGPSIISDPTWGRPRAFGSRAHAEKKARKIMEKTLNYRLRERFAVPQIDGRDG